MGSAGCNNKGADIRKLFKLKQSSFKNNKMK
jgi:hypothetical protein